MSGFVVMLHFLDNFLSFKHYNLLISNFLKLNPDFRATLYPKREFNSKVFFRMLRIAYFN